MTTYQEILQQNLVNLQEVRGDISVDLDGATFKLSEIELLIREAYERGYGFLLDDMMSGANTVSQ